MLSLYDATLFQSGTERRPCCKPTETGRSSLWMENHSLLLDLRTSCLRSRVQVRTPKSIPRHACTSQCQLSFAQFSLTLRRQHNLVSSLGLGSLQETPVGSILIRYIGTGHHIVMSSG